MLIKRFGCKWPPLAQPTKIRLFPAIRCQCPVARSQSPTMHLQNVCEITCAINSKFNAAFSHNANTNTFAVNARVNTLSTNAAPLKKIITPVNPIRLEVILFGYNRQIKDYIISGFVHGFRLGYIGKKANSDEYKNHKSIINNMCVVKTMIDKEIELGKVKGPFDLKPFLSFWISPLGLVPKKDNTFRLIHDLSYPRGNSVNSNIPREMATVKYETFDDLCNIILN